MFLLLVSYWRFQLDCAYFALLGVTNGLISLSLPTFQFSERPQSCPHRASFNQSFCFQIVFDSSSVYLWAFVAYSGTF